MPCLHMIWTLKASTMPLQVAYSPEVAQMLGLDPSECERPEFAEIFAGNAMLPATRGRTYSQCYGGHQFGSWAGEHWLAGSGAQLQIGFCCRMWPLSACRLTSLVSSREGSECLESTPAGHLYVYPLPVLPVPAQQAWIAACRLELSLLPAPLDGVGTQPAICGGTLKESGGSICLDAGLMAACVPVALSAAGCVDAVPAQAAETPGTGGEGFTVLPARAGPASQPSSKAALHLLQTCCLECLAWQGATRLCTSTQGASTVLFLLHDCIISAAQMCHGGGSAERAGWPWLSPAWHGFMCALC